MNKCCLILLFIAISFCSFSQSGEQQDTDLEGKVISSVNKKPLENVPVLMKYTTKGTVTSPSGYFLIPGISQGKHHIVVDYIGYKQIDTLIDFTSGPAIGINITLQTDCTHDRSKAESDIKMGQAKLLLVGSIAPVYYPNQHKFERKYKVKYLDFGCTPPAYECIEEYNKRIFEYLDNKYGKGWRKEVRQDVEYLAENK